MNKKIKIGVVGIGMVGAPLVRWFLDNGFERGKNLFCYDNDKTKNYNDDILSADVIFICVPTPSNADGSCNIKIVESVAKKISKHKKIIVLKSTVPPGTTEKLSKKYNKSFWLFFPEFLTEARAWEDFIRPDRQIVAPANNKSKQFSSVILDLLPTASFCSPGVAGTENYRELNSTEAEMAKYGGNAFGSTKVTFANILADYCDALEIDCDNVCSAIGHDKRIGSTWMNINHGEYRGFGGYCFPKDLKAMILFGEEILKKLNKKDAKKAKLFTKSLNVLKSIWEYNEALLNYQGLTVDDVSIHDEELAKKTEKTGKKGERDG